MSVTDKQCVEVFASKKRIEDIIGIEKTESETELELGSPEGCIHLKKEE